MGTFFTNSTIDPLVWRYVAAVLVQPKDEGARRFYMACAEFIAFPGESRTLFLPVETLVAAYG